MSRCEELPEVRNEAKETLAMKADCLFRDRSGSNTPPDVQAIYSGVDSITS